jgi:hypothetical protein
LDQFFEEWVMTVATAKFTDFYEAWIFLWNHPIFDRRKGSCKRPCSCYSMFEECLDIDVVKVNPRTNRIDDDKSKNTATRIWLECGPWLLEDKLPSHDPELNCGGATFEEAILTLANKVYAKYGNPPRH